MNEDRPNILLLTVDALRADRTTIHDYDKPTTPVLAHLAENAIVCDNAFSLGPFTQSASVQLFTSTRPLSYGGFDKGATGRPDTLFKFFNDRGYQTSALSTLHWVSRFSGYGAGLEDEIQLFTLNTLVGVSVANMRNTLSAYRDGELDSETMLRSVGPIICKLFDDAEDYCNTRLAKDPVFRCEFPNSQFVNAGYDFGKVRKIVFRHRDEYKRDPLAYVKRHLNYTPEAHQWLAHEWRYARSIPRLAGEAWLRFLTQILGIFSPGRANRLRHRFKHYVDAPALADKVISMLEGRETDRPFFIWTHFMDCHLPYVSGTGRKWFDETAQHLDALNYPSDIDPTAAFRPDRPKSAEDWQAVSALYDASVRGVDKEIGRIVDALDIMGLGKNTWVVIAGDHGEELGEHGDLGHNFVFYEHSIRTPMMFRRLGEKKQRTGGLATSLDLAPTIASLCKFEKLEDWVGSSVCGEAVSERPHVVMETFFGGNCLFHLRPIYLGVRNHRYKFLWKEWRDPRDKLTPDEPELYDLKSDPEEKNNIFRPDHPALPPLRRAAAERLAEIPEISSERIVNAFGEDGRSAIAAFRHENQDQ